jgi:drug/metabolite transporter (DMT)-like permease
MPNNDHSHLVPGVPLALASALLFGASTPFSKLLLRQIDPQMLAGLLYLGAGLGLAAVHLGRTIVGLPGVEAPLRRSDLPWLAVVAFFGGLVGPLLSVSPEPRLPRRRFFLISKASPPWRSPGCGFTKTSIGT